ncbi:MAG: peptidoglycan LD-endopeptidase LytH, partial [Frankiaceae bacterium]|nr:peptidoglycan LD-endopeptidase LytH [Frankiaceae bacterium]
MPRYVRFSGLFLTAAVLVTGCTSSPKPAATAGTATPVATTSAAGTPTVGTSASATPLKSASPTSAKASASPTATPSPSASPSTTKPSATPTPTHAATPTPTPTPTKSATKPPADPIVAGAYAFPVAGCTVSYGAYHHDYPATDILAPRGCHFVAPTSGTVDEVGYTDKFKSSTNDGALRGGL